MKPMVALVVPYPRSNYKTRFFNSQVDPILSHATDEYLIESRSRSLQLRLETSSAFTTYATDESRRRFAAESDKELLNLHWIAYDFENDDVE